MENTENLKLPYIMASQAQKHITHNEALRMLDALVSISVRSRTTTEPPDISSSGARFVVPEGAVGGWSGWDGKLAAFQDGAWVAFSPSEGWRVWIEDEAKLSVYTGGTWTDLSDLVANAITALSQLEAIGIGTSADPANPLSVSGGNTLFNHNGSDHRLKLNKASEADTASVLFQSDWSGHAELGLAGSNSFQVKTSNNGTDWNTTLEAMSNDGRVRFPSGCDESSLFGNSPQKVEVFIDPANGDDQADGATVATAVRTFAGLDGKLPGMSPITIKLLGDIECDHQLRFNVMVPSLSIFGRADDDSGFQNRKITVKNAATNHCGGIALFAHASVYLHSLDVYLDSSFTRSFIFFVNCLGYLRTAQCSVDASAQNSASLFANGSSFCPSQHAALTIHPNASGRIALGVAAGANPNADWRYPSNISVM